MRRFLPIVLLVVCGSAPLAAQRTFGTRPGGSPATEKVVYLSGRVVLEDGAAPPDLVTIERFCLGGVFPEGFTEPDGKFSIRVGTDATAAIGDASAYGTDSRGRASGDPVRGGGLTGDSDRFSSMKAGGTVDLIGCELRARLDGFSAVAVPLTRRSIFDNPDLGIIVLKRDAGVTGSVVSVTSLKAPKNSQKLFEKARKEAAQPAPRWDKAAADLEKAVAAYPEYAAAWAALGEARIGLADEPGALAAFARSVEADPQFLKPYLPLTRLLVRAGDWQAVVERSEELLALNPQATEARFYHALAHHQAGASEPAAASLDVLLADETQAQLFPQARHVRGVLFAEQGRYDKAAEQFTLFLEAAPNAAPAADVRRQIEEWRALGVID